MDANENLKYDIGDPVWFLNGSTIVCAPIENIVFDRNMPKNYQIIYKLQGWEQSFPKKNLYGTLKEAIKGLDKK